MTPTAILALVLLAMAVGAIVGHVFGERRGRDLQRVADILDQWKGGWRKLPPRNVAGQFTKKEGKL